MICIHEIYNFKYKSYIINYLGKSKYIYASINGSCSNVDVYEMISNSSHV